MALDPAVFQAEGSVCHSKPRKRTHDEMMGDVPQTEHKKQKTLPPPALKLNSFSSQQMSPTASQVSYRPFQGVDFSTVDYNSPATTIESPQLSPKSCASDTSASMGFYSATETHPEPLPASNNQLISPLMSESGLRSFTPFTHYSESSAAADSIHNSFSFLPDFGSLQTFEAPSTVTSTTAQYGSFPPTPCQPRVLSYSHCFCFATQAGCHHHHHSSFGWRRASSMTLPVCYQNHPSGHDVSVPHTAPLPTMEPVWSQPMPPQLQHVHQHAYPHQFTLNGQSAGSPIWSPNMAYQQPIQASPTFGYEATTTNPTFGGTTWAPTVSHGLHGSFEDTTMHDTDHQERLGQNAGGFVSSVDPQSWVNDLDTMVNNAGHWYI